MNLNINYADPDEKFIKTITVYAKKGQNYVYADAACTVKIDKDTLMNLCRKSLIIVSYEGAFYPVAAYKLNATKGCLDVTIYDVLATTVAAVTVHSSEYTA